MTLAKAFAEGFLYTAELTKLLYITPIFHKSNAFGAHKSTKTYDLLQFLDSLNIRLACRNQKVPIFYQKRRVGTIKLLISSST